MRDYERTVISQYSSAVKMLALLDTFNDCIDPRANLEQFYNDVWNIDTARGYGLDVWGRIVGINRVLLVPAGKWFGFEEATNLSADPFNSSPLYSGQPLTQNYALADEAYRQLIFAKAAANLTNCSIPAINQILMNLFPNRGNAFVAEGSFTPTGAYFGFEEAGAGAVGFNQAPFGDLRPSTPAGMRMTYVFQFQLALFEVAIVTNSGVLPKPTGVLASAVYLT